MDVASTVDRIGTPWTLTLLGLGIGMLFGFFAQRSRFCLRSAVIEFAHNITGGKLTVWLFAFSTAVLATQGFILLGWLDVGSARQLAARGSLSGALIGGAMFGVGMILARGCSSRLLVPAANGNLRALLSGLVFAVTAQAAWVGVLAPARKALSELWTIEGGAARDLIAITGIGHVGGLLFGAVWLLAVFTLTSWATLAAMRVAAAVTDRLADRPTGVSGTAPAAAGRATAGVPFTAPVQP